MYPYDYEFLFHLALQPFNTTRWRYRGTTPSFEHFVRQLHEGVLAQFVVDADPSSPKPIGLVSLYQADLGSRTAYVAALSSEASRMDGSTLEGLLVLLDYAFSTWDFRKMYAETNDSSIEFFASAIERGFLIEEGRLKNHDFLNGVYSDRVTYALYQDTYYAAVSTGPLAAVRTFNGP